MIRTFILTLFFASNYIVFAQTTWNTQFAFILQDENNEAVNLDKFKESYKLINVYGDTVSNDNLIHYLRYDEKTNYFILDITTIGPRFSFALIHNNDLMVIYLPFIHEYKYYATDFKFRPGRYLFGFDIKDKEKIYFNSNMPHFIIGKINLRKQSKKLSTSSYADDETYNTIQE
jgi:hypothetical protein